MSSKRGTLSVLAALPGIFTRFMLPGTTLLHHLYVAERNEYWARPEYVNTQDEVCCLWFVVCLLF